VRELKAATEPGAVLIVRRGMRGIFVTGTDTGVGKTIISAALARALVNRGMDVGVLKPFSSGAWEDTKLLKKAAKVKDSLKTITPYYFKHPLAPYASLQLERRKINPKNLKKMIREAKHNYWIVEGIGGALVPVTERFDALDIAKSLHLPVLIVGRLSLGTLNHTLLTVREVQRRGLRLKGIILNAIPKKNAGLAEKTNPNVLRNLSKTKILGTVPFLTGLRRRKPDFLAKTLEKQVAIDTFL